MLSNESQSEPIAENISRLGNLAQFTISYADYVRHAFILGLWYQDLPECALGVIEKTHGWNYQKLLPAQPTHSYSDIYPHLCAAQFVAQTGDAWHPIYQDFRRNGFRRLNVYREGGRLQYLMHKHSLSKPLGYRDLHVVLDISIASCKQVQVGTEVKEVPVMKTVCEDLVEIQDTLDESVPGPQSPDAPANLESVHYDKASDEAISSTQFEDEIPF